jgi:hypothetical protein
MNLHYEFREGWPQEAKDPNRYPIWEIKSLFAHLVEVAREVLIPACLFMMLRHCSSIQPARRIWMAIATFYCVSSLFVFAVWAIYLPNYRYPISLDVFFISYHYLFQSLPLAIVLIARK